jgi:hypothetical protein
MAVTMAMPVSVVAVVVPMVMTAVGQCDARRSNADADRDSGYQRDKGFLDHVSSPHESD